MSELGQKIDSLVEIIYTPDQVGVDEKFLAVLDGIEKNLQKRKDEKETIQYMNEMLVGIQQAYMVKDYIYLADLLVYGIKTVL